MNAPRWTIDDVPDCTGRTVLITGSNSGLGLLSSEVLAARGAHVLMTSRNAAKGAAARDQVARAATGPKPDLLELDLMAPESIHRCADEILGSVERLDVLVNNAGIMAMPLRRAENGYESHFATNHLGHFALTGLLLPILVRSDARVVTISSQGHRLGKMKWDDLGWSHRRYSKWFAYSSSKLANALFIRELDRRARAAGTGVVSVGAHPGYTSTHLQLAGPDEGHQPWNQVFWKFANKFVGMPESIGVLPGLYAASMPDLAPADYFGPRGFLELSGYPEKVDMSRAAQDVQSARRLWEFSEELTGVRYEWHGAAARG